MNAKNEYCTKYINPIKGPASAVPADLKTHTQPQRKHKTAASQQAFAALIIVIVIAVKVLYRVAAKVVEFRLDLHHYMFSDPA